VINKAGARAQQRLGLLAAMALGLELVDTIVEQAMDEVTIEPDGSVVGDDVRDY